MKQGGSEVNSQPAPTVAGFYYIVMHGSVEPSLSSRFDSADERDAEVSKIFSGDEEKPVEYDEACDVVLKMDIDGNGKPEIWTAAAE